MGKWITGDVHVHSHCCWDGSLAVDEIVERAKPYCDFLAISGHARHPELFRVEKQHEEVLAARKKYDMPIFNTGEIEFPVPRHAIVLTDPADDEYGLLRALIENFDRRQGVEGVVPAVCELEFIRRRDPDALLVFNHPNAPDVPLDALLALAPSPTFRIMACVDRGERRAPQTWNVGAAWDQLLMRGHRVWTRCGSDFHRHFADGGHDYYPGEFVQDHLWVEENSYAEILSAYREGRFFCTVGNAVANPEWRFAAPVEPGKKTCRLRLAFDIRTPLEWAEIIGDGKVLAVFRDLSGRFEFEGDVPLAGYYRVRGLGVPQPRAYGQEGAYEPLFLLNPIFTSEAVPCS